MFTKIKRESGENPEQTGHCKWGATFQCATENILGKVKESGDPQVRRPA